MSGGAKKGRSRARWTSGNFWRDETSPKQEKATYGHRYFRLREGQKVGDAGGWTAICTTCSWRTNKPTRSKAIRSFRSRHSVRSQQLREDVGRDASKGQAKATDGPRKPAEKKPAKQEKKRSAEYRVPRTYEIAYDPPVAVVSPEEIFEIWKEVWFEAAPGIKRHFELDPGAKQRFLARSEVAELGTLDRSSLREAITKHQKLKEILEEAKALDPERWLRPL